MGKFKHSHVKQRSKDELLHVIACYEAVKTDVQTDGVTRGTACYWRLNIEWAKALITLEDFSTADIKEMLKYIRSEDLTDFSKKRQDEIREKLKALDCEYIYQLKNLGLSNKKDLINQTFDELRYYNSNISNAYCLLACEWLMDKKHFDKKQLDQTIELINYLDNAGGVQMEIWRDEIFKSKNIWINLNTEKAPKNAEVI